MKILVVHEVNYLSKIVYEYQILPEILSILGHDITIVDYNETWQFETNGRVFALRTQIHRNIHRAYAEGPVNVHRPGMIRLPVLSRLSGGITSGLEVSSLLASRQFDAVLLYGLPTVGVQTVLAAKTYNVPVVFRSIDIMHELAPSRLLSAATRLLERFVYTHVDGIIALTDHLSKHVQSYGVPPDRLRLLPCGVDTNLFSNGERDDELLARWGIKAGDPVVLFMGTIYRFSGLDRVIRDFPKLLQKHPGAKLLVVGWGEDEARLKALAQSVGVQQSVIFTGLQPYALLPRIIRSSDVCINPFELNAITRDILPNKLFQYLATGRPLLATPLPGTKPILPGESQGVVYTELDGFVDALSGLLDDPARRKILGQNAEAYTRKDFDWKEIAARMVNLIRELTCA